MDEVTSPRQVSQAASAAKPPQHVTSATSATSMRTVLTYRTGAVRILGCLPAADLRPEVLIQHPKGGFLRAGLVKVTTLAAFYMELERA